MPDSAIRGCQLRLSRQYGGLQHLLLRACQTAGVNVQFMGNVWGMDESAMKAAGTAANGSSSPVVSRSLGARHGAGHGEFREISKQSDPAGTAYRPLHYVPAPARCAICWRRRWTAPTRRPSHRRAHPRRLLKHGRTGCLGTEGVCPAVTWTDKDHRGVERSA